MTFISDSHVFMLYRSLKGMQSRKTRSRTTQKFIQKYLSLISNIMDKTEESACSVEQLDSQFLPAFSTEPAGRPHRKHLC